MYGYETDLSISHEVTFVGPLDLVHRANPTVLLLLSPANEMYVISLWPAEPFSS